MSKTQKILFGVIAILLAIILFFAYTKMPYQVKKSHARTFARTQTEYMQKELQEGKSIRRVMAVTQANITQEHKNNTDVDYTKYVINIDEKAKTCRIDVTMAYGSRYETFSSEELKYDRE